jgi:two-component system nitrate/nitrite response regulator NarL
VPAAVPRSRFRVLILDDHVLFAESLELALTIEGYAVRRIAVAADGRSPQALITSFHRTPPHVVLLDLDLGPWGDGVPLITPMTKAGINVVVVTASVDRLRWGECLHHGARTVLNKSRPLNDILAVVRRINQDLPVQDLDDRESLIALWRDGTREHRALHERLALLTPREETVLGELMRGHTVREIAASSVVSEATVRTQVRSILAKLEVSSQLSAVGVANEAAWRPRSS